MYTPKIREDLIPRLYRLAKSRQTTMTTLVNDMLRKALDALETAEPPPACPTPPVERTRHNKKGGAV
jgi:hypothetical protein